MSTRVTKNSIAFSTLGCPEWSLATVVRKAAEFGYDKIEWRGGSEGHVTPAMTAAQRAELSQRMKDTGVTALAVTSYTSFVSDNPADRQLNLDHLRHYLDLAADLGSDFVRVFLGELSPSVELVDVYDRILECLEAALQHAKATGVGLAIEPHDDFVRPQNITPILNHLADTRVGVVWDIGNTYAAGETVADGFQQLRKRLLYVQVKDSIGRGPQRRLALLGEGEVPLTEAFRLLIDDGYEGSLSYEWERERAWYPEVPPPEVAFPAALQAIRALLASAQSAARTQRSLDQA
jgi:sugar phosphate isomerase/epimerase